MRPTIRSVLAAAATAVLGLAVAASPAAAQYPGQNGQTSFVLQVNVNAPCFTAYHEEAPAPFNHTGAGFGNLAYSPDGEYLAAVVNDHSGPSWEPGLWVVHVDTCTAHKVTTGEYFSGITWSPDGEQLAAGGSRGIQVLDAWTGEVVRTVSATGVHPSWSARGSKIAYADGGDVWVAPAMARVKKDGSTMGARLVIADAADPDFSPDGKRIAFLRGNLVGHAAATNGGGEKLLPAEIDAFEVVWSPDGQYFLVAVNNIFERSGSECSIVSIEGVYQSSPGNDPPCYSAAWQPIPVKHGR